jgi:hypothetical protein
MAGHKDWMPSEKATHLLAVLKGKAANNLHGIPTVVTYEEDGPAEWKQMHRAIVLLPLHFLQREAHAYID